MNMQTIFTLEAIGSFLEKLAEKSESVYWLSSPDFKKIQFISEAYERIWGRSREVLYKNPELWITYVHPDDVKNYHPISAMAERIVRLGSAARYEESYRIIRPNGDIRWIVDRGFPICDDNGICCGVTGVAIDITQEKQNEEKLRYKAEVADKAKAEFLANMRHDIRTPLTGIVGCASMIKEEAALIEKTNIAEYANDMLSSSYALLDFLNEVLEAVCLTTGEVPQLRVKFLLKNTINHVIDLFKTKAKIKNLDFTLSYDDRISSYLIGDSKRIHRIFLELVSNAINFTDQGYVHLATELIKLKGDKIIIKFSISDSGIGIVKDKRDEIFLRFNRLTPSYQGVYKGAGLGLAIVKQFIDDLNGEIYVVSELNKGSTFTCFIPLKLALVNDKFGVDHDIEVPIPAALNLQHDAIAQSASDGKTVFASSAHVLVVEDQPIAAQVADAMLRKLNCVVDIAETGQAALLMVKKGNYDFIFMDVGLPDINGNEVTRQIREWELVTDKHIPIIALTAHIETHEKQKCVEAGMDAVLSKPLSFETARDILHAFVPRLMAAKNAQRATAKSGGVLADEVPNLPELIIDLDAGAKMYGGNVAMAKEILQMLADSLPDELAQLEKAHQANDWKAIKSLAHKMRGGASYCGAIRLQATCRLLEEGVSSGNSQDQEKLYHQVLNEMLAVQKYAALL